VSIFFHKNFHSDLSGQSQSDLKTPRRSSRRKSSQPSSGSRSSSRRGSEPRRYSPRAVDEEMDLKKHSDVKYKGKLVVDMTIKELKGHLRDVHYPDIARMNQVELEGTLIDFILTFPPEFLSPPILFFSRHFLPLFESFMSFYFMFYRMRDFEIEGDLMFELTTTSLKKLMRFLKSKVDFSFFFILLDKEV